MKYTILFLLLTVVEVGKAVQSDDGAFREKRSDDVSVDSLETLVQQQGVTIQALQARVSALENRELPTTFKPVAFTVHFSHDDPTSQHGVALGDHSVLQFDTVVTNIGTGYDPKTGIFTAPVAGVYVFFLTMMASEAQTSLWLAIEKHDVVLDQVYAAGSSDHEDQGSTQVTTHMTAGEQVWVRQEAGSYVRGSWWTVFTGYLLQAE